MRFYSNKGGISSSLAMARAVLDQGNILVWFPEGRRTRTGDVLPFQPGIGALIEDKPIAVVPAYISGTFEAAPVGRRLARLTRVQVQFGVPKTAADLMTSGTGDTPAQRIASGLQQTVSKLDVFRSQNPSHEDG